LDKTEREGMDNVCKNACPLFTVQNVSYYSINSSPFIHLIVWRVPGKMERNNSRRNNGKIIKSYKLILPHKAGVLGQKRRYFA
jgi:hypothetical protein